MERNTDSLRIERQITIGLITSTDFAKRLEPYWASTALRSTTAKRLCKWCWEYFKQHKSAPGRHIEVLFWEKVKTDNLPKEVAEEIELEILPSLSDEFEHASFNVEYVLQNALKFLSERKLENLVDLLKAKLAKGEVKQAEELVQSFTSASEEVSDVVDLSSPKVLQSIDTAFEEVQSPLFKVPGALGDMLNPHLIRGGFVAMMAREKLGKTWTLIQLSVFAAKQGVNVAFFQAGDMTRTQFLRRMAVNRTHRNIDSKYCVDRYIPVKDCIYNQCDTCDKRERACNFGIFNHYELQEDYGSIEGLKQKIDFSTLLEKVEEHTDYQPCTDCKEYRTNQWGVVWLKHKGKVAPLTAKDAKKAFKTFFIKRNKRFQLATYANGSLSVGEIEAQLKVWEKESGFIADMIVVDYADLLVEPSVQEERAKQNMVWKKLRGLSQSQHCLVLTVTQADAASYEQSTLKLKNFSEDKRKYAHATAFFGLNQDPKGREKKLQIMRVNELVVREGAFEADKQVTVLQDLASGQAFIGSMW